MTLAMKHFVARLLSRSKAALIFFAIAGVAAALEAAEDSTIALKRDMEPVSRDRSEAPSYADVVKRVSPSVVKITTEVSENGSPVDMDELRAFGLRRMPPEMRKVPRGGGLGSGVIISAKGYIATNNHVVDGADRVTVTLTDGRVFPAKVVGRDKQTDIAVIKVNADNLPAVTLADTSKTEVGDRVLAIGNPFGIGETVTSGIVSAKGRNVGILADVEGYEDFIQTDAAINPGNSGGALVDVDGRLLGINTAILSRSGGSQGVGLAVPANMVAQVAESLVKSGKVVRGFLGVNIQDLTPVLAESFSLSTNKGALVSEVSSGGPADQAGVQGGDIVVALNDRPVTDANDLKLQVSVLPPGSQLNLEVFRNGEKKRLMATSGERPDSRSGGRLSESTPRQEDEGALNGVAVDDLNAETRRQLNIPSRIKGAVITGVAPDSAAAQAGLRQGDVIMEINKRAVNSAEDAVAASAKVDSKKSLVKLWSRGSTIFVVVDESGSDKAAS
jgi:serine protease Do